MRMPFVALLAGAVLSCAHAARAVRGRELRSDSHPPVTIRVRPPFTYEGRVPFSLHDEFDGERFVFVDAQQRKLTRLFVVQFEQVRPGSSEIYRYSFDKAETIGPLRFRQNPFAFAPAAAIVPSPRDEGEMTNNFLLQRGYVLPKVWLVWRFVTLGDADRKSEMIVFYMEGSDELAIGDLYRGDDATPKWQELMPALAARARSAFTIDG